MSRLLPVLTLAATIGTPGPWARSQGDVVEKPTEADRGDTVVVSVRGDADGFLSVVNQTVTGSMFMDLMLPLPTNSGFADGHIIYKPAVAESWEFSDDRKTLTYHLRKDLTWDDKQPITAHDWAFTYDLIRDPDVLSPRRPYIDRMVPGKPWEVLDDYTIRFNFVEGYNEQTMLAHSGLDLVPKHLLEDADRTKLREHPLHKQKPVGHNRFRLLEWDRERQITLVRNPRCLTQGSPYLRRIQARVIPEYATCLAELKAGKVDLVEGIQVKDLDLVGSWPNVKIYERGYRFLDYVAWNQTKPLFADRRVRRALTMAIDIESMIKSMLTTDSGVRTAIPAYSTFTPELKDYYQPDFELLDFDIAAAKKLLAEAGWTDSDDDGVLDKDGRKFSFTLVTNTGNPRRRDAGIIIKQQLGKLGLDVKLDYREPTTFFEELRKKEYEAAIAGWSAGLFPDPSDIWMSETEEKPRPFNQTGYSNPEADRIIAEGLRTTDPAKEKALWMKLHRIVYDDQPYTFLFWRKEYFALDKRFRGVEPNVLSVLFEIENWWVPKAEHKYKF